MLLDERNEFADAVALSTAGIGRALIGDVIDLGATQRDIGAGEPLYLVITIDTAVGFGAAGALVFELASDAQAAIATDGTATVHYASGQFNAANPLPAGAVAVVVALPMEGPAYERYLGVLQNVSGNALTAGKVNAFLTHDVTRWKAYDSPSQAF